PTLAEPAAGVLEFHANLVVARRYRLRAHDVRVVDAQEVVTVFEPAVLAVQAPAADVRALRDDDPFRARLWYVDVGGDRVRLVLDVDHRVFRQAPHAGEQDLGLALDEDR